MVSEFLFSTKQTRGGSGISEMHGGGGVIREAVKDRDMY